MAYIQKITPPPNSILNFSLRDFSGGLNNRYDQIESNEASDILNMDFADETLLERRRGQEYFDESDLINPIVWIDEYIPYVDEPVLIKATESVMYVGDDILTTLTGKTNGINHMGQYFFTDGSKLYTYGIFDQIDTTYINIIGTPIDDYVLMEVVSPTSGHPRLDSTHQSGVLNVNYTDFIIYYEPCDLEFLDVYSGANVLPSNSKFIQSHLGRLYIAGDTESDDNITLSDVNNPYYFPVALPVQLPPNSDKITGMIVYDNSIIVGRNKDIYSLYGETNNPELGFDMFNLVKLNTHTGFASQNAVDVVNNYLFYLGNDGNVYSLSSSRTDYRVLATQILTSKIDIFKYPISVIQSDLKDACSIYFDNKWYLSIDGKVLKYNYLRRAWTLDNNINATSYYNLNNTLIWGNSSGRVAKFSSTEYTDFGTPYKNYFYSKFFNMDDANSYKQFREFYIVARSYQGYRTDINVLFEIDYSDVENTVVVSSQISVWGISKFGDRFINRYINDSFPITIGRRGRNIRIKVTNGYFIDDTVDTYDDLQYYVGRIEGLVLQTLDTGYYYLYTSGSFKKLETIDYNQPMKIHEINGDYEMRGKR